MRYEKPSLAYLGVASAAIQGHGIKGLAVPDADESQQPQPSTGSAYDLDE